MPPDFSDETSGDVMVPEGGRVQLTCRAKGHPAPHVQWRREDGQEITVKEANGIKSRGEDMNVLLHVLLLSDRIMSVLWYESDGQLIE